MKAIHLHWVDYKISYFRAKFYRMKSILILFILCLTFGPLGATILRVNNNSAVLGTYTTAQAAHNAATAGDTIHIESSVNSYGSITCTKPLVWIGNGFFSDAGKSTYIDLVQFQSGSANSVFMGIHVLSEIQILAQNITVNRCSMHTLAIYCNSIGVSNNFSLSQSFVRSTTSTSSSQACSGFTFTNNYFYGSFTLTNNLSNIVYSHNFFNTYGGGLAVAANNNIFNNTTSQISLYPSTVYNNLFVATTNGLYVGMNGNIFVNTTLTSSANTVFTSNTASFNDNWTPLRTGSPALNAGLGGAHIGPTGGTAAYKLSGVPPIPTFTQFQVQSAPVNTLPVTISVKSNN